MYDPDLMVELVQFLSRNGMPDAATAGFQKLIREVGIMGVPTMTLANTEYHSSNVGAGEAGDDAGGTFAERLFQLAKEAGMDDAALSAASGVDAGVLATLRANKDHKPEKRQAQALGLALKLHQGAMDALLARAGYRLEGNDVTDLILVFCFQHETLEREAVNEYLAFFDQPAL